MNSPIKIAVAAALLGASFLTLQPASAMPAAPAPRATESSSLAQNVWHRHWGGYYHRPYYRHWGPYDHRPYYWREYHRPWGYQHHPYYWRYHHRPWGYYHRPYHRHWG
jgi:hypothetical protein